MANEQLELERQRCVDICLDEYRYWKNVKSEGNQLIEDYAFGACGAAANMLARILDPKRKATGENVTPR